MDFGTFRKARKSGCPECPECGFPDFPGIRKLRIPGCSGFPENPSGNKKNLNSLAFLHNPIPLKPFENHLNPTQFGLGFLSSFLDCLEPHMAMVCCCGRCSWRRRAPVSNTTVKFPEIRASGNPTIWKTLIF